MAKIKLTKSVRELIRTKYKSLKDKDFRGEALIYLHRVQGAAKARKIKKSLYITIGDFKISKRSEAYEDIVHYAKAKGMSVKEYLKEYERTITRRLLKFKRWDDTHLDKLERELTTDLPTGAKIYNNDKLTTLPVVLAEIDMLRNVALGFGFFPFIQTERARDLQGNIWVYIPTIEQLITVDSPEDMLDFLHDDFSAITLLIDTNPRGRKKRKSKK